jgi:signal transduction histidine kinase
MEITGEVRFTPEETTLLEMHSVLNVLNVLQYEFLRLGEIVGSEQIAEEVASQLGAMAKDLRNRDAAESILRGVDDLVAMLDGIYREAHRGREADRELSEIGDNLEGIFAVLRVRARELVSRRQDPRRWVPHDIEQLRRNFVHVFRAIERNSHGGFRIVDNLAMHHDDSYLVHLQISTSRPEVSSIDMPPAFQDVMRDLLANARKYTDPGGRIDAGLYDDGEVLRFVVEDTGWGIPADEVEDVVKFGHRGSNVENHPTRGGGFGLTKAYYVTRVHDGRMWIEQNAAAGHGTRIEIRIPTTRPAAADTAEMT